MGQNTVIVIYNDALNGMADDPHFGKTLHDAILMYRGDGPITFHTKAGARGVQDGGQVITSLDSNDPDILVEVGGNTGRRVTEKEVLDAHNETKKHS